MATDIRRTLTTTQITDVDGGRLAGPFRHRIGDRHEDLRDTGRDMDNPVGV